MKVQMERKPMITWQVVVMILVSVSCSALAQISLKHGMSQTTVQVALASGSAAPVIAVVATSATVWLGLFLYGFSALIWLFVLARLDVSVAYAFVALGFLLTMTLGCLLLGEPLNEAFAISVALVAGGLVLVNRPS